MALNITKMKVENEDLPCWKNSPWKEILDWKRSITLIWTPVKSNEAPMAAMFYLQGLEK